MGSYTRSEEDRALEITYAQGNGLDVIEYFQNLTRAEGWVDGGQDDE